jgi:hypothetical protein
MTLKPMPRCVSLPTQVRMPAASKHYLVDIHGLAIDFKIIAKIKRNVYDIFFTIIVVTSINLETFEIQLMEFDKIANIFVLCDVSGFTDDLSLHN